MNKIGIIYGSTTGTTEDVARRIAKKLDVTSEDIHDASGINKEMIEKYDVLLLGSSTWGDGELQDDWYDGVKVLKGANLSQKSIGLFGCGDCESYSDTFCDAIGVLYKELAGSGCTFCGSMPTEGYTFDSSAAVVDGMFVGLPLDEGNEDNETDKRIDAWLEEVRKSL